MLVHQRVNMSACLTCWSIDILAYWQLSRSEPVQLVASLVQAVPCCHAVEFLWHIDKKRSDRCAMEERCWRRLTWSFRSTTQNRWIHEGQRCQPSMRLGSSVQSCYGSVAARCDIVVAVAVKCQDMSRWIAPRCSTILFCPISVSMFQCRWRNLSPPGRSWERTRHRAANVLHPWLNGTPQRRCQSSHLNYAM